MQIEKKQEKESVFIEEKKNPPNRRNREKKYFVNLIKDACYNCVTCLEKVLPDTT